jgi:hypothetical protein
MTLITTIGAEDADSYVTLAEADSYIETREGFNFDEWDNLEDEAKEWRLTLAALILNNLKYRGVKASKEQNLSFPRITPTSPLWRDDETWSSRSFDTWTDLESYATLEGLVPPTIPSEVKKAQIEVAFQVVHSHYASLAPMEQGDVSANFVGIGKLQVRFDAKGSSGAHDYIDRMAVSAISIVKFLLGKHLGGGLRGMLV